MCSRRCRRQFAWGWKPLLNCMVHGSRCRTMAPASLSKFNSFNICRDVLAGDMKQGWRRCADIGDVQFRIASRSCRAEILGCPLEIENSRCYGCTAVQAG